MSILVCCYALTFVICCVGLKRKTEISDLSKDTTTSIRGFGMLLIIFSHAIEDTVNNYTFFFYVSAILGVSACFLVSGYGLYISYRQKENYLKGFLILKFARLLIPYLIFYALYLLSAFITGAAPSLKQIAAEWLTLQLDGLLLWYLKIQLLMYIFFYIAFRFMKTEKQKFLLLIGFTVFYCVVAWRAGLKNYWYNTCFFFPIGVLLANRQAILLPIIRKPWAMIISGTLTVTVFVMIYFFGRMGMDFFVDGFYMLFFNIFLLGLFGKIGRSVFLNILGKYSMEIYLAHLLLLNTHIYGLFSPEKGTTYLLLIFLTVAVSAPVYYISNKLTICLKNVLKKKKAV